MNKPAWWGIVVCFLIALAALTGAEAQNRSIVERDLHRDRERAAVPARALEVYTYVLRTGRAPEGYVGGRVWENREHRLPPGGHYQEYDVNPKVRGKNRGPERIVVDRTAGRGWYTPDHYSTFTPLMR